jgi:hypothetical protein
MQRTEAGTLSMILNNRAGDYDPTNTGSPHYPGVKRRRWIRVSARWDGVSYVRWTGLIETYRQRWPSAGHDALVEVTASDATKVLSLFDLDGKSYASQRTDERFAAVCTDAGVPYTVSDSGVLTIDAADPFAEGSSAYSHLQQVEESENGLIFAGGDGTMMFQSRHYRVGRVLAGAAATFGENAGEIPYKDSVEFDLDDADIITQAKVTPNGGTAQLWPPDGVTTAEMEAHFTSRANRSILSSDAAEALGCAQYLVHRYGDPSPRLPQIEALGVNAPTNWATILALKNSDYVTWNRRAAPNAIALNVFVERVAETIVPGGVSWSVQLQVSPAVDEIPWIAADPVYGVASVTTVGGF